MHDLPEDEEVFLRSLTPDEESQLFPGLDPAIRRRLLSTEPTPWPHHPGVSLTLEPTTFTGEISQFIGPLMIFAPCQVSQPQDSERRGGSFPAPPPRSGHGRLERQSSGAVGMPDCFRYGRETRPSEAGLLGQSGRGPGDGRRREPGGSHVLVIASRRWSSI